jgi:DNA-binding CsgD family transcriptional regulator
MNDIAAEKTMTVKDVAAALGISPDTVLNNIKDIESQSEEIRFGKVQGSHGGKPYYVLNEAQVTAVKMNLEKKIEVKTRLEKAMTTREVTEALKCEVKTVFNNAKICLAGKRIENGKETLWTEAELTILLEYMKRNNNNQYDLVRSLQGTETAQSLELEAALAAKKLLSFNKKLLINYGKTTWHKPSVSPSLNPKPSTMTGLLTLGLLQTSGTQLKRSACRNINSLKRLFAKATSIETRAAT